MNTGKNYDNQEAYIKDRLTLIKKEIEKASSISIFIHINPDGDCISSGIALCRAIRKLGKEVFVYSDEIIPEKYKFLPYIEYVKPINTHSKKVDLSISVDVPSLDRIGPGIASFLSAKKQIMIDHHISRDKFADITCVDSNAAACTEIIFKLIKMLKQMDDEIAILLFTGIVTDTGCFQFANTTNKTFQIVSELREYNIDSQDIIYRTFSSMPKKVFELKKRVLNNIRFYENDQIGIITFRNEDFLATGTDESNTEGIISAVRNINCIKIAISICETKNSSWKISFRSMGNIDSSYMASVFGGGGHKGAAGCRISGTYEDVVDKLLKVARDNL